MNIIEVDNLGKMYRIGVREARAASRAGRLRQLLLSPFAYWREITRPPTAAETLWAVRDVSFTVPQGNVLGLVGRNGAGKSTLLKVLSRITTPTTGRAVIRGRVGSLLEVGTGFHPELTGRENIYLNGSILGMRPAEIDGKFDEIVAFAEIERFLDTPVKRYSSGMYVRLAFAVAAHLDPEVLLVDEVLAVGDAAFQKKCLGKIGDIAGSGRTIIFVSHNMAAIANICQRAILLEDGQLTLDDATEKVLARYLSFDEDHGDRCWSVDSARLQASLARDVHFTDIELLDEARQPLRRLTPDAGLIVRLHYALAPGLTLPSAAFVVRLKTELGAEVLRLSTFPISGFAVDDLQGSGSMELILPALPLVAGEYLIDVALARPRHAFYVDLSEVVRLRVDGSDPYASGENVTHGLLVLPHRWQHRPDDRPVQDSGWKGAALNAGLLPD